jgi:hypothetical protein
MAARNNSRGTRTIVRSGRNLLRTIPTQRSRRKPAREPLDSKATPCGGDLQDVLSNITRHLRVIGAMAITAEVALRSQNCEQDADIAECLRSGVVDAITTQMDRLNRLCVPSAGDAS